MNSLYADILLGILLSIGILSFIFGEFVTSSILFAITAVFSHSYWHQADLSRASSRVSAK